MDHQAQSEKPFASVRISRIREIADGIKEFELVDATASSLPAFTPGAHIAVEVPNGSIRKYSLCNDPHETNRYVIAVKREEHGRGGSRSISDDASEGGFVRVSEAANAFPLVPASSYLFIAGGIGITPILAMIRWLEGEGKTNWKLCYLSREPATTAYLDLLSGDEYRGRVLVHHDYGDASRSLDLWPILEKPGSAHIYCCGPRPLMDAVRDMSGHWPREKLHFESFIDGSSLHRAEDKPFAVRLAKSGKVVAVPADKTILETLREAGLSVPSSCESGSCGSCRTMLICGEADHRDFVLTSEEQEKYIMVCVSRAKCEQLVVDL